MQGTLHSKSHASLLKKSVWFKAKLVSQFLTLSFLLTQPFYLSTLHAAPVGGEVVGGSGSINQSGLKTTINQNTQNFAVDWKSFDVNTNEQVNFVQPNSSSIALNRILGNNGSTIQGQINANGQVILVNPNGVLFTSTATINVGGLVASSLDMTPTDFMNGNYIFSEVLGADGAVINSGIINASLGGLITGGNVALIGKQVKNDGLISANLGSVVLAAGKQSILTFDNQGLIGVTVTKEVLQEELGLEEAVVNSGEIKAAGGRVLLTASTSQDVFSQAVNNDAFDLATSVIVNSDGSYTLGNGADVINTGSIDVSSQFNESNTARIILLGENVTSSGSIKADSTVGNAGEIELHAKNKSLLTESSITSAQALTTSSGGLIKILGDKVGLFDKSEVNASGANGGGEILIGGDRQGLNASIRNADFIYLGENTTVKADATANGNGGKLITFANDTARLFGNLYARGGSISGDGGFIETSGKQGFYITNTPDITATNGYAGHWLIDPNDISIVANGLGTSGIDTSVTGQNTAFDSTDGTDASIEVGLIENALINGTNATVTITTSNPDATNTTDGNITFTADLNFNGAGMDTLILNAANNINTNRKDIRDSNTGSGNDKLNIVFNADADLSNGIGPSTSNGSGNVFLNDSRIYTNGGSFTATGQDFISNRGTSNGGTSYLDTRDYTNNTKGGDVFLYMKGDVDIGAEIITGGGKVDIGDMRVAGSEIRPTSFINQNNGIIDTTGEDNINGGSININVDNSTPADGTITINANLISEGGTAVVVGTSGHIGLNGGVINLKSTGTISGSGDIKANGSNGKYDATNDPEGRDGGIGAAVTIESTSNNIVITGKVESKGGDADGDNETGYTGSGAYRPDPASGGNGGNVVIKALAGSVAIDKVTTNGGNAIGADISQVDGSSPIGGSAGSISILSASSGTSFGITINDDIKAVGGQSGNSGTFGTFGNGNAITFTGPVTLTNANGNNRIIIDASGDTDGDVAFKGAITTSENNRTEDLTILAKKIDFEGAVGTTTTHLRDITITATGAVNAATNNMYARSLNAIQSTSFTSGLIDTSGVITGAGVNGGGVSVNSNTSISISSIDSRGGLRSNNGNGRNGGNVQLNSESIVIGEINTSGGDSVGTNNNGGNAGTIALTATQGVGTPSITLNGDINASGGTGSNNPGTTRTAAINLISSTTSLVTINHATDFTTPVNVTASAGSVDTIIGAIRQNTWNVTSTGFGTLNTNLSFTSFETLNGNSDIDTFILSGDITNQINGFGNNDIFNIGTSITGTIDGGLGTDELVGANVTNYWDITANDAGTIYTDSGKGTSRASFVSIETLTGNTAVDEFNLAFDVSNQINGMGGNDIFNILTNVTGAMAGGLNDDTFNISSNYSGTLTADAGNDTFRIMTTGLTLSQQLDGGLGTDELIAANELNVWDVAVQNEGTIYADTGKTTQRLTFTSFETLTGNAAVDQFDLAADVTNQVNGMGGQDTFNIGFNVSADLNGGLDIDTFNVNSDLSGNVNGDAGNDIFEINTSVTGTATLNGGDNNDTFNVNNPNLSVVSIIGGDLNETTGDVLNAFDEANYWNITGLGVGTIAASNIAAPRLSFSGIENLTGSNTNNDTFVFSTLLSSISGVIDGRESAGDNDIVDLSLAGLTNNVVLGSTTGYTNIEEFIGNGTNSTITGENYNSTWTFTAANTGKVTYLKTGDTLNTESKFTNFAKLNGGNAIDTFELTFDVTSEINGNGGNDIYNVTTNITGTMDGGAGDDTFNINSVGLSVASIIGGNTNETTGDVLNAFDEANYWNITGAGTGTLAASGVAVPRLSFSGIENLTGSNTYNDTFVFSTQFSSISGVIDGGESAGDNDIVDLSLAVLTNNINLGPTVGYTNIEEFIGNGTNSTITGENFDTTWSFTANNTGKVTYSTDGGLTTTESKFTNFAKLNGGNAIDTFDLSFDVTSEINGNGGNDIYNITTNISGTMDGGAGNDTFNVNNVNLSVASIIGGDLNESTGDVLNAANEVNYWDITGAGAGTLAASSIAVPRLSFSGIETMVGGDLKDDFKLANSLTNVGNIFGGIGANSLTAGNDVNYWDITAQNSGAIYTDSTRTIKRLGFSSIQTLNGNAAADEFNLAFDVTSQINGLGGNDRFIIGTNITGAIAGGAGSDTLTAANVANYWDITAQNSGAIYTDSTRITKRLDFSSIETLNGNTATDEFNLAFDVTNQINGSGGNDRFIIGTTITGAIAGGVGIDTLTAANVANFWDITAQNSGAIYTDSTRITKRLDFTSIETLNGNASSDEFNLAFDVTNQINGSGGNDRFIIGTTITGAIAGGSGSDTLTAANVANFWDITALNSGAIYTDSTRITKRLDFTSIETLNGNANVDRFNLAFDVTNQINGQGGSDRFDISATITGAIAGGAANDNFYINNSGLILTKTIQGGTGTDTLYAANENNYWNLNTVNGGEIHSNSGMTAKRLSFSGIETVNGNAGTDSFLLNGVNNFAGSINGGSGTDKLTAGTRSNNWAITSATSGIVSGNTFSMIEELVGGGSDDHLQLHASLNFAGTFDGAGGVDEIIGGNRSNTWFITEENTAGTEVAGTVTGLTGLLTGFTTGSFKNIETLTGNVATDSYTLLAGVTFNGSINGQAGNNSLTAGNNASNTWTIKASNTGTVTGMTGDFSNIQSLTGGTFIDEFNFYQNGFITGLIDGNSIATIGDAGHDVINIAAFTGDTTVKLGVKTVYETSVLNVDHIEQINAADGGTAIVNTIVGDDRLNTWVITADNTGYVQETGSSNTETKTAFSNFEIVHGGNLDDSFQFIGNSKITDTIDGKGGVNSIDYSAVTGSVVVNLNDTGTGSNKILNVTGIKGNKTNSTIFAKNGQVNTWEFYGTNRGEVGGVVFTDFNILEGGDLTDTFNFNGASPQASLDPIVQNINLQIKGNAGDDVLNVNLTGVEKRLINFDGGTFTTANTLNVTGGNAGYYATYAPNVSVNTDSLSYTSGLNTFEVNYTNTDTIIDSSIASTLELVGSNVSDTFTLTDNSFNVTATTPGYIRSNNITYSGKTNIIITGSAGDIFELPADLNISGDLTLDINTINDNGNLITAAGLILANTSKTAAQTLRTNISRLSATNTGDLYIIENDGLNLTGLNTTRLLDVSADGSVFSNNILNTTSLASLVINTTTGNIDLSNSSNTLLGALTLNAPNGNVTLNNSTTTSIAGIITNTLNIDSMGAISQTDIITSGSTSLRSNSNITLALDNDFDALGVSSAVNVRVNDVDDLAITNINATGFVNITSNGLTLGSINSNDIYLNSGNSSIVGTGTNIVNSGKVVLSATNGISLGLNLNGSLTATNSGNGDIDIIKSGNVILENITNNNPSGSFRIISNSGDIVIKKVVLDYDNPLAEIKFDMQGAGNIYGDTTTAPHVRSNRIIFAMNGNGSVGKSNNEPIVTDVKEYIEVTGALGTYIRYFNGVFDGTFVGENEYKNIALQIIENLSGQQLIQIESLAEIDPAIFTDVRNYSNSDIALMMPSDQRYTSDDDEDKEAKAKREKFLNSTP